MVKILITPLDNQLGQDRTLLQDKITRKEDLAHNEIMRALQQEIIIHVATGQIQVVPTEVFQDHLVHVEALV
jgi:hypothetical protein